MAIMPSLMNRFPGVIDKIIENTVRDDIIRISENLGKVPTVIKLRYSLNETANVTKIRNRIILKISFNLFSKNILLFARDEIILYLEFTNLSEN